MARFWNILTQKCPNSRSHVVKYISFWLSEFFTFPSLTRKFRMIGIFASWKQLNLCRFMLVVSDLNIYSEVRIVVPENSRSFDENEANEIAHALTKCPVKSPKRTAVEWIFMSRKLNEKQKKFIKIFMTFLKVGSRV